MNPGPSECLLYAIELPYPTFINQTCAYIYPFKLPSLALRPATCAHHHHCRLTPTARSPTPHAIPRPALQRAHSRSPATRSYSNVCSHPHAAARSPPPLPARHTSRPACCPWTHARTHTPPLQAPLRSLLPDPPFPAGAVLSSVRVCNIQAQT